MSTHDTYSGLWPGAALHIVYVHGCQLEEPHAVCVGHVLHVLLTDCRLCVQLQSIMEDRLTELSALHWGLSGQLSQAEADLRDRQLPELEEQASAVKAHVTVSQRQVPHCPCQAVATDCCSACTWQVSQHSACLQQLKGAANGAVTQAKARRARLSPIKPADALLIRCHDMLHTQDEGIRHCLESLRLVEDAVAAAHAQQPVQLP